MIAACQDFAESKRAMLLAGLDLFAKKGVDAVSLADIAAIAGYSRQAPFKFYKTKLAMAVDIFSICYCGLYSIIQPVLDDELNFPDAVKLYADLSAKIVVEHSESLFMVTENFRLLWPETTSLDRKNSIFGLTMTLLNQGQKEGFTTKEISIEDQAAAIIGYIQQTARVRFFSDEKKSHRAQAEAFRKVIQRVLGV